MQSLAGGVDGEVEEQFFFLIAVHFPPEAAAESAGQGRTSCVGEEGVFSDQPWEELLLRRGGAFGQLQRGLEKGTSPFGVCTPISLTRVAAATHPLPMGEGIEIWRLLPSPIRRGVGGEALPQHLPYRLNQWPRADR